MDERARRIGKNEALFRQVNERIEDLNQTFGVLTRDFTMICECGDRSCIEQIRLAPAEYERIRSDSALFAIIAAHEAPDVESVVEKNERYWIVRKDPGPPAALADALDERSP